MARPVGTNSILEVSFRYNYQGSKLLNIHHYRWQTVSPSTADGDAIVNAAYPVIHNNTTGFVGAILDLIVSTCTLVDVRYQWIFPTRYSAEYIDQNCTSGRRAEIGAPSNSAAVITKRTPFAGARGLGSWHQGGFSVIDYEDASFNSAFLILLNTVAARLDDVISTSAVEAGSTLTPVIWSRLNPTESPIITDAHGETSARVMRRRTLGVGQ